MGSVETPDSGQNAAQCSDLARISARPRKSVWWYAAAVLLFALTVLVMAPLDTSAAFPAWNDLDSSWVAVLRWAYLHHLAFGTQILFPHGPWGFIEGGFDSSVIAPAWFAWLILAAGYSAGLVRIAAFMTDKAGVAAVWLLGAILLSGQSVQMPDARIFMLPWFLLLIHFYIEDGAGDAAKVILLVSMGLASLVKFSYFLCAAPVVVLITFDDARRWRIPASLIVYGVSLAGFWLAAGQPLSGLGVYLYRSWIVSNGYTEGEAMITPASEGYDVARFVAAGACVLGTMLTAHPWRGRSAEKTAAWKSAMAILGAAAIIFLIFKSGYVRHGGNEISAMSALALAALSLSAVLWRGFRSRTARVYLVVLCCGVIYESWTSMEQFARQSGPTSMLQQISAIPRRASIALRQAQDPGLILSSAPDWAVLPRVNGPVDIYSWGQRELLEEGLDYTPRPIFQSYVAYTAALAEMNAEFLRGPGAAKTIFFDAQAIDHHLLSLEDAASWPELLSRYDLTDASGNHLVLTKAALPREYKLRPIGSVTGRLGEWIAVPQSDDPIWAKVDISLTALGKAARVAYKPPVLAMGIQTAGGGKKAFRYLREVGLGGFLLSPVIEERGAFGMLYSSDWKKGLSDEQAAQMTVADALSADGRDACYEDQYTVRFFALQYPRGDISKVPGVEEYLNLRRIFLGARILQVEPGKPPRVMENDEERLAISADAFTRMLIEVPPGAKGFDFGYGMSSRSYLSDPPSDGVDFRIYAVDAEAGSQISAVLAWSAHMDPGNEPADRGLHRGSIQLAGDKRVYGLILETSPGADHWLSESYWTGLKFR